MTSRRIILGLIVLTVVAFGLLAAAKLSATPKFDRIQVGMTAGETGGILGPPDRVDVSLRDRGLLWNCDEGTVLVTFDPTGDLKVESKLIKRRGPLERLMWLAGWR